MCTKMNIASYGFKAAWSANEVGKMQKKEIQKASASTSSDETAAPQSPQAPAFDPSSINSMPERMKSKIQELSGHMFSVMWHFTQLDIESTLARVCRRVLRDKAVSDSHRMQRARGLAVLGEEFSRCGCSLDKGMGDLITRMSAHMTGGSGNKEDPEGGVPVAEEEVPASEVLPQYVFEPHQVSIDEARSMKVCHN